MTLVHELFDTPSYFFLFLKSYFLNLIELSECFKYLSIVFLSIRRGGGGGSKRLCTNAIFFCISERTY